MGETQKVNWNYYVKALQAFKMGERLGTYKTDADPVEYTYQPRQEDQHDSSSESATFIFKNLPDDVICDSYYVTGKYLRRNDFCTSITVNKHFTRAHDTNNNGTPAPIEEGLVFARALPGVFHVNDGTSVGLLIEGVKKLYDCYVQTQGSDQCLQETGAELILAAAQARAEEMRRLREIQERASAESNRKREEEAVREESRRAYEQRCKDSPNLCRTVEDKWGSRR